MCALCQVARKSKNVRSLLMSSTRGWKDSLLGGNSSVRMFGAVPEPTSSGEGAQPAKVDGYVLHPSTLNENLLKAQYAVRGELYNKAVEMAAEGKDIIYTNVGNPQQLGEKPITYNRQVQALVSAPFLMEHPKVTELFPEDVIARAKKMLGLFGGALGAYTDSRGALGIRKEVAEFIERRDGVPANPDNIYLTDGASVAVRYVLNAAIRDENDAILVPIPQYPLYSASIQLYGGTLLPYYLKEEKGWGMDIEGIRKSVRESRANGTNVRAIVFINPGNPTGQCMTADDLKDLVKLAYEEGLVLLADEVYQPNVYQTEKPFISAKKIMAELGAPYSNSVELASFHTVSKGVLGECGLRGGYVEFVNFHPDTIDQMYKAASINLSPNTTGQLSMSLMANPPKPGEASYESYKKEMDDGLASLTRRAHVMTDSFNALEGVTCTFTEGAMYSFPRLHLPPKAVEAAKAAGKTPDTFYCLELLKETGIVTVPGAGFGQEEGTFHMRTTILPQEAQIAEFVQKFKTFHEKFMDMYR